jgi:hypothetical protein
MPHEFSPPPGTVRPTWIDPFDERQDVAARLADLQVAA